MNEFEITNTGYTNIEEPYFLISDGQEEFLILGEKQAEKLCRILNEKWEMSSLKFESDTANLLQNRKIKVKDSIFEVFFKKSLHKFSTKVNDDIKNNNMVNTPIGFELLYKNYKYRIVMFAQEELIE